jgi:hypothetical protein
MYVPCTLRRDVETMSSTLLFEFKCRQVLLVGALLTVNNEKESVHPEFLENGRMIKTSQDLGSSQGIQSGG